RYQLRLVVLVVYEERLGGISNIEIPSRFYLCLPSGEKASNGKYNVRGWADIGQLSLHSDASARSHSGKVRLYTAQAVQVTKEWFKEKQGWIAAWKYQIHHMVEGNVDGPSMRVRTLRVFRVHCRWGTLPLSSGWACLTSSPGLRSRKTIRLIR
ncbi:hypothetical protein FOZ62_016644, partial [Perkinsus olseni]